MGGLTSHSYVRQGVIGAVSVLMNFVVMSLGVRGAFRRVEVAYVFGEELGMLQTVV